MANLKGGWRKFWRYVRLPVVVLLIVWGGFVLAEVNLPVSKARSDAAVAAIHAQRLTMADVDGSNLPPEPDPRKNNATVAGIDANQNGIRDDVELAIFDKYPNNAKVRAAELQYAKSLQTELVKVINTETLEAALSESDRAYKCVSSTAIERSYRQARIEEVETLVHNTAKRVERREDVFRKFMTTTKGSSEKPCDVEI